MGDPEETTQQHGAPGAGAQPSRAVFLSYASQDAEAARKICEALRAAGIEVWFDQSELRGGDVWDQAIRRQIKTCALFIPVISKNTHARDEGYFRLEWRLAVDRCRLMADDKTFLLPVVIDDTRDDDERVPERFREVQWTRLPAGDTPASFVERVRRLILPGPGTPLVSVGPAGTAAAPSASRRTSASWPWRAILLVVAVVAVVALGYVILQRLARPKPAMQATTSNSIAVLPLVNESGEASQQYFSDGISEDLITALSQFPGLKVIGRTSAFQFRDSKEDSRSIGSKLGVAHLLEGSVRKSGDMIRVSAELIDTNDGSTQWTERYDRPYKDLFALQDEITRAVAGALRTKLLPGEQAAAQSEQPPSGSLEAYNAFLQGRFYYGRGTEADFHKAIQFYTQATYLDPRYAVAWSALSVTWTSLGRNDLAGAPAREAYAKARDAVDRALALAPELAAAHGARGWLLMNADLDWRGAEAEIRRGLALSPNDGQQKSALGRLLATLGDLEQAVELTRQALATEPLRANWYHRLSMYLSGLNRLDEAEGAIRKAIEIQPTEEGFGLQLAVIEVQRGNAPAALAAAQRQGSDWGIALARQIGDDRAAANLALQALVDKYKDGSTSAVAIADVYALRQDADKAFEWLERAWSSRDPEINTVMFDPFILRYKNDPRFAAFCRKVGFPVPGESTGT